MLTGLSNDKDLLNIVTSKVHFLVQMCVCQVTHHAAPPPGKLKEWSLVLYGTSVHPYSLRSDKPRSTDMLTPTDEEFTEEYTGKKYIHSLKPPTCPAP